MFFIRNTICKKHIFYNN